VLHLHLATDHWTDNGQWLMGLKRLIETVGQLGVTL
jgi:protein transport protein SEC31